MTSQGLSCSEIDNSFQISAQNCRDAFDFTLLFEQSVLGLLPLALLLLVSPFRIFHLIPRRKKVNQSILLPLKIVSLRAENYITKNEDFTNGIRPSRRPFRA